MKKRVSLQRLITLSVLSIGLLSGTFGLAYAYWQAKHSLRATIGLTFQELARQSADKAGLILDKEIEWVERLSALPEVREAVREGTRFTFDQPALQRWRETQQRYFRSIVILDREGRSVGGVTSEATRTYYNAQPWWPVVLDQRRSWAGELRLDERGDGYWEVAVPIMDENGAVLGALKVVIEKDQLLASVLRSRIGNTGHVMLLGTDGMVLACPILPPARHTTAMAWLNDASSRGRRLAEAVWREVQDDTHGHKGGIVGLAPVALRSTIVQAETWYLLVRQDPAETYAPLHILLWKLSVFGVLAIAVVVVLRWRLARRIVLPINRLVERVQRFGQAGEGGLPAPRTEPSSGIVEIDALAASFDELTERLERASRESRRYVRELEQANREIAMSEEHYRMLWNHSLHLRLLVGPDGLVRELNRRGEIKLWRAAEKVVGTPVVELFAEQDRANVHRLIAEVFATGKERTAGELNVPAPTGDFFIMELDLVPVEKTMGTVEAVMLQLSDLTEKKHLQDQLLRSERLASLSKFASMFAHDIRNPLAGIKKTLELMAQREELQVEPVRRWCEDLQFTVGLLQGMISDMLDVYQESYMGLPLLTSAVPVSTLVDEALHLFRTEAEARQIVFRREMPECEILLTADRRRLLRVFINLVHNALKYSPVGGVVTITVDTDESAHRWPGEGASVPGGGVVTVRVADEGPGIEPEDLPHLFEMFFRKNEEGRDPRIGRGLGLHFCRLVVEAHHGVIHAENRPTGGALFALALPLNQEAYVGQTAHR